MPSGIQVFNDAGHFQIDSEYTNFRLTNKVTLSVPGPGGAPPEVFAGVATTLVNGVTPLVAVRSTAPTAIAMIRQFTPTTFMVRAATSESGGATVDLYIFDQSPPTPGNCGLQVWNGAGKQVYDSSDKSLRVVDQYKQGNVFFPGGVATRSYPGKKIAVVMNGMLRFMQGSSPPSLQWECLLGVKTPNDSTLERSFFIYRRYLSGLTTGYVSNRNVTDLVVDVTGY